MFAFASARKWPRRDKKFSKELSHFRAVIAIWRPTNSSSRSFCMAPGGTISRSRAETKTFFLSPRIGHKMRMIWLPWTLAVGFSRGHLVLPVRVYNTSDIEKKNWTYDRREDVWKEARKRRQPGVAGPLGLLVHHSPIIYVWRLGRERAWRVISSSLPLGHNDIFQGGWKMIQSSLGIFLFRRKVERKWWHQR